MLGQLEESDDTQQHFRKIPSFQEQGFFFFCSQVSQQENEQLLKFALNFALVLLHIIFCEQLVKVIKSLNFVISQLIFVNFFHELVAT